MKWLRGQSLSPLQVNACKVTLAVLVIASAFTYVALRIFDAFAITAHVAALTPFQAFILFGLILSVVAFFAFMLLAIVMEVTEHRKGSGEPDRLLNKDCFTPTLPVLSHQLRNPLSAIRWMADMLHTEAQGQLSQKELGYVEDIQDLAKRMSKLINAFLDIGKLEAGTMPVHAKDVKLDAIVAKVVRDMREQRTKSHMQIVVRKPKPSLPIVRTDETLIFQALTNVLHNAMRYSRPGKGLIEVVASSQGDGSVRIEIRDEGIGIPESSIPHIFKKFYRAPNAVKMQTDGTGLGLYISKHLVELLGGSITFTSKEGKGSTFVITIPSIKSA